MPRQSSLSRTLLVIGLLFSLMPVAWCAETINLQLRWHHQFQFAGYYAALQQGYYQQAGLDVVIHEGSPEKIPVNEVSQGHAQYGVANSELLLERLKGKPLVLLAAIYQHSPSVLLARKDSGIYAPSDLIGKNVMMLGSYIDADFVAMFHNEHLNMQDVHIIPSSFDIQDLASGKIDAFNSYVSNEPFFLKQQGIEFTVLHPRNYGVDFYSDMLFTSEDELQQHPKRVQAFLKASLQGWQYALDHPQEIIALLQSQYQVPKTKAHLEFEAESIHSLILPDLVEIGHINPWRLQHMAATFVEAGMVSHADLLEDFIYLPDAAKERLKHYLKVAVSLVFFIMIFTIVLSVAYSSIKRENRQRKRVEAALRQRSDELALHNAVLQKINQGLPLSTLLEEMARQVEKLHPRMICSILLLDEENKLRYGAAPSLPDFYNQQVDGLAIAEGVGSCGTAAFRGERFIVEDIQQHPFWQGFQDLAKKAGVQSCWSQPIKDGHGKVLGTFAIYHTQPRKPLSSEIELIESYASLTQLAIEHTRTTLSLLESEQRLRLVLKGSGVGFWDWRLDGQQIVEVNTSTAEIFRYHCPEIPIHPPAWLDFVYSDDRASVWQSIQQVLSGEQNTHQIEYRVLDALGNTRWILDRANVVQRDTDGKPTRMSGTHTDITELKAAEQKIKQLAFYDVLTQLPNRRLLNERFQYYINLGQREARQLAVLMLDLDRFKAVNDNLGHSAGDELLQKVATRIKNQLRDTDTVARLGGDEFVVLLPRLSHHEDVERVAIAIISELTQPFSLRETDIVNIGTSIGISFYPEHGDKPEILIDYADSALYQAKNQGRGCFCIAPTPPAYS